MKTTTFETVVLPGYVPEELEEGKIYVVYNSDLAKEIGHSVSYLCPCGCKQQVFLPCRQEGSPRRQTPEWELSVVNDKVVISPSILEKGGCKSHYFIKNGEVQWC